MATTNQWTHGTQEALQEERGLYSAEKTSHKKERASRDLVPFKVFNEILVQIKIRQQIPEASNFQDSYFTYGTVKKSLQCILSSYLQNVPSLLKCYF